MNDLVLLRCPGQKDFGERILHAAEWMGVPTREITVADQSALEHFTDALRDRRCNVVLSAGTLLRLRELAGAGLLRRFIEDRCAKLLVFSVGEPAADILSWLTEGEVADVTPSEPRQTFRFPESTRTFSGPFAGQSFAIGQAAPLSAFRQSDMGRKSIDDILLADGHPVFVRTQRSGCEMFLLALGRLAGIGEPLSRRKPFEDYYDQFIPLLIFFRHAFGAMCWHGPPSTARLIIDDPLLTEAYGCLDFSALRNSMRSAGYGTSIAFIPWNHWRTSKTRARKVFDRRPNLTICVHGCDHTNREFDDGDAESLQWKSDTALRRMECHQSRTGLAFEPVMVFPQGKFSTPAIGALRASGYLAAVNTTCFPADGDAEPLTIADFLRPAITKFYGFPLFQRRYPRRLVDFAFDIFIGRPVLLVQHHQDFRDGYRRLEEFVAALHQLDPAMTWPSLSDQLIQSCMMRSLPDGSREVRFFTSRFRLTNTEPTPADLVFTKDGVDASAISRVEINGAGVPFSCRDGLLTIAYRAEPGQIVDVATADLPRSSAAVLKRPTLAHTAAVGLRRTLSEIRDRTLVKHPRLLAAATRIATRLKATGESTQ